MGAKLTGDELEMVNFLCQLGWATVPIYLIKQDSRCVCEGIFIFKLVYFE